MAGSDLNSVALVGRLTRDAELKYMGNGNPVASISIAVNRSKRENDQWISEASFFDISYFGKGAEAIKPYLTKGKQIAVQGSLRQDRWEKDGQKFSRVVIVANSVELLGGRADGGDASGFGGNSNGGYSGGYQQRSYSQPYQAQPVMPQDNGYSPMDGGEVFGGDNSGFSEDIPF